MNDNKEIVAHFVKSFSIQKRVMATLTFQKENTQQQQRGEAKQTHLYEFDVEIDAGFISDRQKRISLMATDEDHRTLSLVQNVHRVQKIEDGFFVLHGSMKNLQKK